MHKRYQQSDSFLKRASEVIPLASQTFSKSRTHFPAGVSPSFITHGEGCRVWDLDGNEYIDFMSALLAVSLGYNDSDVNTAVSEQLQRGVCFSLSHPLETYVAEELVKLVPAAEMVRFGKNGSDATSGAIRVARAYTGREHVAVCGYHGWQDWYIGSTTRNLGVPKATCGLTHRFQYNDIASLEQLFTSHPKQIAAVILEPMNTTPPAAGFLGSVKTLTHEHGAVLIFDEIITGFRFAKGGAQEYFGVTPDLATLGKGLANGFPLSAVVGKAEIMSLMNDVFYSFTFGGETLSLAAALAVLQKIQNEPVIETLAKRGDYLLKGLEQLIDQHKLSHMLSCSGHPAWSFLHFHDVSPYSLWEIKTYWMQEVMARGILSQGTHNLNYAHTQNDIDRLLLVYDEVFALLKTHVENKTLEQNTHCEVLKPLFSVR